MQPVADPVLEMLDALKERGVTRATFHPDGSLASVEYGPSASVSAGDIQHETPKEPKRARAVGGLVPRAGSDPQQ